MKTRPDVYNDWIMKAADTNVRVANHECGTSETNNGNFLKAWAREVFFTSTRPRVQLEPRLLILDALRSNQETKFINECLKHNVTVVYLPPTKEGDPSPYLRSPIDIAFFMPLIEQNLSKLETVNTKSSKLFLSPMLNDLTSFLSWYRNVRNETFHNPSAVENFRLAFALSGLWPVQQNAPDLNNHPASSNEEEQQSDQVVMDQEMPAYLYQLDWASKGQSEIRRDISNASMLIQNYTLDDEEKIEVQQQFLKLLKHLDRLREP